MKKLYILLLSILLIIGLAVGLAYMTYDKVVNVDTIYSGISVNGVDVSNLNKEDALVKVIKEDKNRNKELVLEYGEYKFNYNYSHLGYTPNYEEGVEKAYSIAREGSPVERFLAVSELLKKPTNINIGQSFNEDNVNEIISQLNNVISTPPLDATFSVVNGDVIVTNEQEGVNVDNAKTRQLIMNSIYEDEIIKIPVNKTSAKITAKSFDALKGEIGSYKTEYSLSVPNRKENIKLAAKLINGTVINPGEQISFNDIIGHISAETGFLPATVINDGEYDTGTGGGICQVSTTLFNAAVRADLKIDERRNHSRPVNYVPLGTDAAVAEGYLDLKISNPFDFPVYISAKADDNEISFSIVGDNEKKNYEIELVSEKTGDLESKIIEKKDSGLESGERLVDVKGYSGYKYQTYKIKKVNGDKVSKDAFLNSTYPARDTVVRVGTGKNVSSNSDGQDNNGE